MKITISNGSTSQTVTPETIDTITYFPPEEKTYTEYSYDILITTNDGITHHHTRKCPFPEHITTSDLKHSTAYVASHYTDTP